MVICKITISLEVYNISKSTWKVLKSNKDQHKKSISKHDLLKWKEGASDFPTSFWGNVTRCFKVKIFRKTCACVNEFKQFTAISCINSGYWFLQWSPWSIWSLVLCMDLVSFIDMQPWSLTTAIHWRGCLFYRVRL